MKTLVAIVAALLAGVAPAHAEETGAADRSWAEAFQSRWQEVRGAGVVRGNYFYSSKALDDETGFFGTTAQLKVLPRFSAAVDGKAEVRVTNADVGDGASTRGRVLEAYLTLRFARADVRVGKQIVAWGRADGINPTDNLTPRDFTVMLPFEEDQRLGTSALTFDAFLSPSHTLSLFTTPFFEPSAVPRPASGRTVVEKRPARTLSNSEIGVRLNKTGADFDWSLSFFRGFGLLPEARHIGVDAAGPVVERHYPAIRVGGADFARNFGRFGFRGEAAYVDTEDERGTDPTIKNSFLYWIIGVDRAFLEKLNVNLQFFQRRVRDFNDPQVIVDPVVRGIAIENALMSGQTDRINSGISFRISNQWLHDTLEAELFGVVNFTRHDSFWRPLMTYAVDDHWKLTVGGEIYRGTADTQYGVLKRNRGAFAELRYGF